MSYEIGDDYEIGDEEIIGDDFIGDDDLEALLGAVRRSANRRPVARRAQGRNPNTAMAAAMAMKRAQSGTLVKQAPPTKSRHYTFGLDSVSTVAANGTQTVSGQPQVVFRPERIVISGAIASSFLINDFKVGKNSQFAASGAVPGDAFSPTAFGVSLKCDTAQISNTVSLNVTNASGGALRFTAAVFGEAVE